MIRRADQREKLEKTMFGGPGMAHFTKLMNEDEFEGHGRLYNHVLLRPATPWANIATMAILRFFSFSRAKACMTTTAAKPRLKPVT